MNVEPLPDAFEKFKRDQKAAFTRIARATRGTHDVGDLESEAWLIAIEIGKRRGCRVDLSNQAEQDQVLAWLYKRFVDFVAGKFKQSIDQESDAESTWHERLAASEDSDPLEQLIRIDDQQVPIASAKKSFSQYSAYVVLLERFGTNVLRLTEYLSVSLGTLKKRIEGAREHAGRQPSLFDGVCAIDTSFMPRVVWIRNLREDWCAKVARFSSRLSLGRDREMSRQERTMGHAAVVRIQLV